MSLAAILAFLHSSMTYLALSSEAFATVGFIPESYNCLPTTSKVKKGFVGTAFYLGTVKAFTALKCQSYMPSLIEQNEY